MSFFNVIFRSNQIFFKYFGKTKSVKIWSLWLMGWIEVTLKIVVNLVIFWLALLPALHIENMKHAVDVLKYTWNGPYLLAWSQGKIPPNLHDLIKWSSVLFQTLPCLEGKTFWGKWDEITRQELFVCMGHSIQK